MEKFRGKIDGMKKREERLDLEHVLITSTIFIQIFITTLLEKNSLCGCYEEYFHYIHYFYGMQTILECSGREIN